MEQNKRTEENVSPKPCNSPYKELEQTQLWEIIHQSLENLEENQDIIITTNKEHVIGYICKMITKTKNIF